MKKAEYWVGDIVVWKKTRMGGEYTNKKRGAIPPQKKKTRAVKKLKKGPVLWGEEIFFKKSPVNGANRKVVLSNEKAEVQSEL